MLKIVHNHCIALLMIMAAVMAGGCRKDKTISITGRLLFSSGRPVPVANYTLTLAQRGSNAIIMGSAGATATAVTNASGEFSFAFTPGKGYFLGLPATNNNATGLWGAGSTALPPMSRNYFPDSASTGNGNTIFLALHIEKVPVSLHAIRAIVPSDTIQVQALGMGGPLTRTYTGYTVAAGNRIVVDTLEQVLSTDYRSEWSGFAFPLDVQSRNASVYLMHTGNTLGNQDLPLWHAQIVKF